jgi:DNA polymerase III subunit delta
MKSNRGQFPGAAERPDPRCRLYLFYGPDEAGSRAHATQLLRSLNAEKQSFTGAMLRSDPGALAAEACAISMFGTAQLLWVEPAGEEIVPAIEAVLAAAQTDHVVVVVAGALKKTSGLLKLVEGHDRSIAHQSFVPEGRDADRLVAEIGNRIGLRISPPLASRIARQVANDRAIITQELTKFALFLGADTDAPGDLSEDVVELLGADASEADNGRAGDLALAGELASLAQELEQIEVGAADAIPAMRALQRRVLMLAGLQAKLDAGQRMDAVMASAWKRDKAAAAKALPRWSSQRLAQLLEQISRLERDLLLRSPPERAALGEELLRIARAARR